jgi:hypothetical protein
LFVSDTSFVQDADAIFQRFADVKLLRPEMLVDALKEVNAPISLSTFSPQEIFLQADTNMSGSVDFSE